MISRGRDLHGPEKEKGFTLPHQFFNPDYSPVLGQILIEQEGTFQGTRSKVAIPITTDILLPQGYVTGTVEVSIPTI